jgi:hypothetical protein
MRPHEYRYKVDMGRVFCVCFQIAGAAKADNLGVRVAARAIEAALVGARSNWEDMHAYSRVWKGAGSSLALGRQATAIVFSKHAILRTRGTERNFNHSRYLRLHGEARRSDLGNRRVRLEFKKHNVLEHWCRPCSKSVTHVCRVYDGCGARDAKNFFKTFSKNWGRHDTSHTHMQTWTPSRSPAPLRHW